MFRRAAKVDVNQPEVVAGLRKLGFSVLIISQLKNCCDLVIGKDGRNWLLEIKPNSKAKLTEGEVKFHENWKGTVFTVTSVEQVLELVNNDLNKTI